MLLTFHVKNFRSIRDEAVFDLRASNKKPAYSWLSGNTTTPNDRDEVVKVKAIYGANASGKSTLLVAISAWQGIALLSKPAVNGRLPVEPFSLDAYFADQPTTLSATFIHEGKRFEYGVELLRNTVTKEWLYDRSIRKANVFVRDKQKITPNPEYFGKDDRLDFLLEGENEVFGPNVSFLAAASLLKVAPILEQATAGIKRFMIFSDAGLHHLKELPAQLMHEDNSLLEATSEMLKLMGIDHNEILAFDKEKLSTVRELSGLEHFGKQTDKRYFTITTRSVKGREGEQLAWLSDLYESAGTQKILQLVPLIILCLRNGGVFIIDEFEAQLHTRLSREIVQLFNSRSGNPNNAQFIFSTHDTNLLDNKLLRRDQISLVEKDDEGATSLYALSDISGVTNTANFERDYLNGSYGAVPDVRDLDIALDLETTVRE